MEPSRGLNVPLVIAGVIVILVIAGAVYVFFPQKQEVTQTPEIDTGPDVSAQVSGAVETPADKLPETNPFSGYKNPFE